MTKFLYGASVQGIQGFIFQTNRLREIIGASNLVDGICNAEFKDFCKKRGHQVTEANTIMAAAGNIRYLFEKREDCEKVVREYPKSVSNNAPGITLSQAVVEISDAVKKEDMDKLEKWLRAQRNRASAPVDVGFMGLERARKTGGVAFTHNTYMEPGEHKNIDRGIDAKNAASKKNVLSLFRFFKGADTNNRIKEKNIPWDMKDITKKSDSSWIAIIHADGNGLGLLLQNMAKKHGASQIQKTFADFSRNLDKATKEAVSIAFDKVISERTEHKIQTTDDRYPLRPVILGGDDLTLIIRADLALKFTTEYLKAFEKTTEKYLPQKLTACAGIAYIKDTYPFHYGAHLAESLTAEAKKFSKSVFKDSTKTAPSSFSFYKVQSSFTENIKEMKERTLYAEKSQIRLDYGPYLLTRMTDKAASNYELEKLAYADQLMEGLAQLKTFAKSDAKGVSKLRNWVTQLYEDKAKAKFLMDRMKNVNTSFYNHLNLEGERKKDRTILFELIQLHSFQNPKDDY